MKAIVSLGMLVALFAGCQAFDDQEDVAVEAGEVSGEPAFAQSHANGGDVSVQLGLCRNICSYGQCGPCMFTQTVETTCYIYNGCGGKYPTP